MKIVHSRTVPAVEAAPKLRQLLETISEAQLRGWIERIAVPRHFVTHAEQNRATADWLCGTLESFGFRVARQGPHLNVVAFPDKPFKEVVVVGAHYDSVPESPGADDNASAVAAMLGCAAACSLWRPVVPAVFVAFNREEEHLLGSRDFVESYLPHAGFRIRCAHVLEMVGFASSAPGSQRVPTGLPIDISDKGDFLGLLANGSSAPYMDFIMAHTGAYAPDLPVTGLAVKPGLERLFPVLGRSDHVPFWEREIPTVMWTDTSEFRNPNYHTHHDTPDTLDYRFLKHVTQLLTACVIRQAHTDRDAEQ